MSKKNIVEDEFDTMTLEDLKVHYDECKKTIADLELLCKKMSKRIQIDTINEKLARIMNKWVKVKNIDYFDENDSEVYGYRVFKVVGVEDWISNNDFYIDIEHGLYVGEVEVNDVKRTEVIILGNIRNYRTNDITKWQVITERQAKAFIQRGLDKATKQINKILEE